MALDILKESAVAIGRTVASTTTFTNIDKLDSFTLPNPQVEQKDTTKFGTGRIRTSIPGLIELGEAEITIQFEPGDTVDALVESITESAEEVQLRYTLTGWAEPKIFTGFVVGREYDISFEDISKSTITFKITGQIVSP